MRSDSMGGMNRTTGGSTATRSPDAILQELHTDAQATMARLRPLRGAEFDRAYMDAQVAMHSKSLNALGALSASARNAELRSHIDMVSRHVQEHLQKGQMIRQQLGGASGTSGAR
jgi:putative membrane protein